MRGPAARHRCQQDTNTDSVACVPPESRSTPTDSAARLAGNEPELLTIAEVAGFLRVGRRTIARLIAGRALPYIRVGRSIRFDRGSLHEWLSTQEVHPLHAPKAAQPACSRSNLAAPRRAAAGWLKTLNNNSLTDGPTAGYADGGRLSASQERR